jgi:sugar fermentation stimulation protein A
MKFKNKLIKGRLIRRYKRFLADVELDSGEIIIAHTTNSGSMKTCIEEGAAVYLSPAENSDRKTRFTWEMIFINNGWVGVNTLIPNKLVYDAVVNGTLVKLSGYTFVKREVKFEDSRFDLYCEKLNEKCFIEVKNVTMKVGNAALFPDAKTTRGKKHLDTLIKVKDKGIRAVMVYVIQRNDIQEFGIAEQIDPDYYLALKKAINKGVEVIAVQAVVNPYEIVISDELPLAINTD